MTAAAPISTPSASFSVTVSRDELAKELALCATACAKRPTIPILAYVLLEIGDGFLNLRATDLELTVYTKVSASTDDDGGAIAIELAPLLDYAKRAPDAKISITCADGFALLQSGTNKHKLPTLPAAEYPADIRADDDVSQTLATVPLGILKALLESTQYAMTEEETRFQVNGCMLATTKSALECIATDGHRLALASYRVGGASESLVLLPRVGVTATTRLGDDNEAPVTLSVSENHVVIACGITVLCVRKQDVNFPSYREIMAQQKFEHAAELEAPTLSAAVSRTMTAANNDRAVALTFAPGRLKLSAADASAARSAEEQIPVDYSGPETLVGMSGKYLVETLSALRSIKARVQFTDAERSMLVTPIFNNDDDAIEQQHLLMPMRLKAKP